MDDIVSAPEGSAPEKTSISVRIKKVTQERFRRISALTGEPVTLLIDKLAFRSEDELLARMNAEEQERYRACALSFEDGQRIIWRSRAYAPPPPSPAAQPATDAAAADDGFVVEACH